MSLIDYIQKNNITQPVTLQVGLDKIVWEGTQTRYMRVKIEGRDVTSIVADFTGLRTSKARDTYGDIIVHGCGMDMGFALIDKVYRSAYQSGYPEMFEHKNYTYLGKRDRKGQYEHERKA